jgi:hypothetical protein
MFYTHTGYSTTFNAVGTAIFLAEPDRQAGLADSVSDPRPDPTYGKKIL